MECKGVYQNGLTMLHIAAIKGDEQLVEMLVEYGALLNVQCDVCGRSSNQRAYHTDDDTLLTGFHRPATRRCTMLAWVATRKQRWYCDDATQTSPSLTARSTRRCRQRRPQGTESWRSKSIGKFCAAGC